MTVTTPNLDDLLAALEAARVPTGGGEGWRVEEIRSATGWTDTRVRLTIRAGLTAGTIRRSRRLIEGLDGRMVSVGSYVLIAPKKGGGK